MNTVAEPIELLEAECSAHGWYEAPAPGRAPPPFEMHVPDTDDETDEYLSLDPACGERVLGWTVERICLAPCWCRDPDA